MKCLQSRKFEKNKNEVKDAINVAFIECMDQLKDDEWFFENFAPGVKVLEEQVEIDERDIAQLEDTKNKYMAWAKKIDDIECSII